MRGLQIAMKNHITFLLLENGWDINKESEEKLYSHNHFESSQIISVFVSFFDLVTSLPFFDRFQRKIDFDELHFKKGL